MANEEQLSILKQGVEVWNKWRADNQNIRPNLIRATLRIANLQEADLRGADLRHADLGDVNLSEADLRGANLNYADLFAARLGRANLQGADLIRCYLKGADLNRSNLIGCHFGKANLIQADLSKTQLNKAYLGEAYLNGANLSDADLREANLSGADLRGAYLKGSNFWKTVIAQTIFGSSALDEIVGLESAIHVGPSNISPEVFALSKGAIPQVFLRGCGLANVDIEYAKLYDPNLSNEEINQILYKIYDLHATRAIQISPLFISYSRADREFVNKIGDCLTERGIRYWLDIHDMRAGRLEKQIDRGIRQNPTVLLVISKHSLRSDWVEHEVQTARELEKVIGRDVLCPVALDNSWEDSPWPKRLMEQIMKYNILDFSEWREDRKFQNAFRKLIAGLELFYKG